METQKKFYQSILAVAMATASILMVPFVAMQFTTEVDWKAPDFIIMGVLLFSTGLAFILITRIASNIIYRIAFGLALLTALFMIWANLAVGLIGSGPNPGNLMYIGVLAVGIIGTVLSHLRAEGMARAMYATSISLVLLAIIALITNMHHYPGSSVVEILGVNAFFAAPFIVAGLLFRYAGKNDHQVSKN